MDIDIAGLNKVVCRSVEGTEVTITDGINTWEKTVEDGVAVFMIASMPAPAKKTYTISIDGYTRDIELGFGDSLDLTLDEGHEPAFKVDVTTLGTAVEAALDNMQDEIDTINGWSRLTASEVASVRALLASLTGKNLVSASADGTTLYLTSI